MKNRRFAARRRVTERGDSWLPIDSRIMPDIFSFGHVKGVARVFLQIEIILSLVMVAGTFAILILRVVSISAGRL